MSDIYKTPESELELEVENNSGGGKGITIPEGIKGWSWGGFLLGWIWAIGNRTWIGLLTLVPYVGLIFTIALGIKGREWAWRNKRWESIEHFNRVQRRWAIWGLVVVGIAVAGIVAAIAIPSYHGYAMQAKHNAALVEAEPVQQRVSDYVAANQTWPGSLTELGYGEDALKTSDGKFEIQLYQEGMIGIWVGATPAGEDEYIVLEPAVTEDGLQWMCYGQNVAENYLPPTCR